MSFASLSFGHTFNFMNATANGNSRMCTQCSSNTSQREQWCECARMDPHSDDTMRLERKELLAKQQRQPTCVCQSVSQSNPNIPKHITSDFVVAINICYAGPIARQRIQHDAYRKLLNSVCWHRRIFALPSSLIVITQQHCCYFAWKFIQQWRYEQFAICSVDTTFVQQQ